MEIRFKLNPKNEKDKIIIDVLSGEYSPAETIKNILYKMGTRDEESQSKLSKGIYDCDDLWYARENKTPKGKTHEKLIENKAGGVSQTSIHKMENDDELLNYF